LDHLPPSLTCLKFNRNSSFNQSIDHLPPSLTCLVLGDFFDKPIDYLPPSLQILEYVRKGK
jgi:hypothetical protein